MEGTRICGSGISDGLLDTIGNTPLIEIKSLSKLTGFRILAKAEHLNPGGSVKDRTSKWLIQDAEERGLLKPGGLIIEATGGNTGVGIALIARAKGYKTIFTMPNNISQEKINIMKTFGAQVVLQPVVPFSNENHYYHTASRIANEKLEEENRNEDERRRGVIFLNQFENLANFKAHYFSTAPEIWQQTEGGIKAFVSAAGTGGTIGGCSNFFKEKNSEIQTFLIDPPGSGLLSYFNTGQFASEGSSITEGIGIMRLTANFAKSQINAAFGGTDQEAVEMAYFLLNNDGIFVGPSAALNCVGAVKAARRMKDEGNVEGGMIVTVLCDGGDKYRSTLYNSDWLSEKNLTPLQKVDSFNLDFVN